MATWAAWQAPPGARPNRGGTERLQTKFPLSLSPDRRPGWLLKTAGNRPLRGMAITRELFAPAIQNPAYRPAGIYTGLVWVVELRTLVQAACGVGKHRIDLASHRKQHVLEFLLILLELGILQIVIEIGNITVDHRVK